MKRALGVCISILFTCGIAWAEPVTVYDVSVEPDSSNKKGTVQYRLGETADGFATVAVNISSNAGESWSVPSSTLYPGSDVGSGIPTDGSLRTFTWDARADWNNKYSTQMMIRVNATASDSQDWVFFGAGNNLYRMNLDGSGVAVASSNAIGIQSLAADTINQKLYMTKWDSGAPVLFYDVTQGGNPGPLYQGPGNGGQGLAYDPATRIFFLGRYYNGLYALNEQHSSSWQHLVTAEALAPMYGQRGQMALDPSNQHVYFRSTYNGTCDACRYIWRVGYDGGGLTTIIQANDGDALALDLSAGHIYFSDGIGNHQLVQIMRSNLDGSNAQLLLTLQAPYQRCLTMDLDVPNNKMYLYLDGGALPAGGDNYNDRAVAWADLDGTNFEILWEAQDIGGSGGIAVFPR